MGTVHAKDAGSTPQGMSGIKEKSKIIDQDEIILSEVPAYQAGVTVQHIHVNGVTRSRDDVLQLHLKRVFSAKNFEDMVKEAQIAKVNLEKLGMFKTIGILIDTSKGRGALADGYDITYQMVEHRRFTGGISTLVGSNEGSLMFNAAAPNLAGRAEKVNAEYIYGTKNSTSYSLVFTKPLQADPNLNFRAEITRHRGEFPWSGYKEVDTGVAADLSYLTFLGQHNIRWEGVWRDVACMSTNTPMSVREQVGHSVKSAVRHTWQRDSRDSKVMPTRGRYVSLTQEIAGLGGDTNYVKHETEMQWNRPLFWGCMLQLSVAGGIMKSIHPPTQIRINDRFFLGGPLTLRGFNFKGVGPRDNGCALGADTYWLSGIHLYTPLPFLPGKHGFGDLFRTHVFANAGNLANVDFNMAAWRENVARLSTAFRWSYGVGLVLQMGGIARLELNYCLPGSVQPGDGINPGVQFGIGVHFL